jgi:hypothetical protein
VSDLRLGYVTRFSDGFCPSVLSGNDSVQSYKDHVLPSIRNLQEGVERAVWVAGLIDSKPWNFVLISVDICMIMMFRGSDGLLQ